jgi:hypothetical protein
MGEREAHAADHVAESPAAGSYSSRPGADG